MLWVATHASLVQVRILTARQTTPALHELIEEGQLPSFLGGTQPSVECMVAQAQPVPTGLGLELEQDSKPP